MPSRQDCSGGGWQNSVTAKWSEETVAKTAGTWDALFLQ